jgi:hypothetical protein
MIEEIVTFRWIPLIKTMFSVYPVFLSKVNWCICRYLKNQVCTDGQKRFQFFNSFFFRKLVDNDPSCASDSKKAFQRVRSWTKKFDDLFEKDYLLIPVNYK